MKLKLSILAGALALAVTGQANAAFVDMSTGSSDLILNIWDTTTSTSYSRDLGINMSTFMAGVTGTSAATLAADSSGITMPSNSIAADSTLSNWLATGGTGGTAINLTTTSWDIVAGDTVGTSGFQQKNFLVTSTGTGMTVTNQNLLSGGTAAQAFLALAGTTSGTATSFIGSGSTYAGGATNAGGGFNSKWTNTNGAIGSTLNFLYMTPSSTTTSAQAGVVAFNAAGVNTTWSLATDGTLVTNVAAVPEPGEWALMLSGFGLIGFIAARRKKMSASMTFA